MNEKEKFFILLKQFFLLILVRYNKIDWIRHLFFQGVLISFSLKLRSFVFAIPPLVFNTVLHIEMSLAFALASTGRCAFTKELLDSESIQMCKGLLTFLIVKIKITFLSAFTCLCIKKTALFRSGLHYKLRYFNLL